MKHLPPLDGVRGAALLMVLAHNFNIVTPPLTRAGHALALLMDLGWLGVQLFFVLSGFLITGILLGLRDARGSLRAFWGRRVLRIFPLYYAVLLAAFVVAPRFGWHASGAEHQIWLWTYLGNWAEPLGWGVAVFPHFWSLAIEEQFYLAWPFVVRALSPRGLTLSCAFLILVAMSSRMWLRTTELGTLAAYTFTLCRVDALALGAVAAIAFRSPRAVTWVRTHHRRLLPAAGAALVLTILATRGAPRTGALTQSFGYTAFAAVFALIVLDVALEPYATMSRLFSWRPLRAVGRVSYGMYVFHMPLHQLVGMPLLARVGLAERVATPAALVYFCAATAVTYSLGVVSYHGLEKHFLALKRFFPSGAAA